MPREVYLEPSGSPFVHNAPQNHDYSMGGDSTLTDLSFQDNDNLLNASGFAGLADVTAGGIGDDTSMMKMSDTGGQSGDMLMGVKGDEFLEDDSMAFELSNSTTTTRARSKFEQSTTAPPEPEPEPEPVPVEQKEKPRRKKSTRSRSSSPSKKRSSAATTPVVEEPVIFSATQMETMQEEPEPEPEPKLRRSPRKARSTSTRLGASVSAGISPFASTSSQPSVQPTPESAQSDSSPAPETAEPEPKPKRATRVVGRSKSKSRAKSARVEEPLSEESPKPEESVPVSELVSTPIIEREPTPIARETTPIKPRETTPVTPQTQPTPPTSSPAPYIPIQATSPAPLVVPPTSRPAPTTRQSLASVPTSQPTPAQTTRQSLAPASATRQSLAPTPTPGPTPFKFNLPPSFGRRAQSLAPTPVTPGSPATRTSGFPTTPGFSAASGSAFSNPVSALPSPALALTTPGPALANAFAAPSPAFASDPPSTSAPEDHDDLKYEQPSKEEEEEAVAIAMRITRRDSSIFATLMSPLRTPAALSQQVDMDRAEGSMERNATGEEMETDAIVENAIPTEPAPVPKRTRVGRGSTRVRGGAGVAVAVMGRVAEDEDVERVEALAALVEPQGHEQEQQEDVLEEEKHILEAHQDVAMPVNFNSRSPSPTPPPPPPGEPGPSASLVVGNKPKPSFGTRTRTTRSSMPTAQPARTTRSTRRSEVPPTSRALVATTIKETLIERPTNATEDNDTDKPIEDVSTPIRAASIDSTTPLDFVSTSLHNVISASHDISTTPLDSPAVSAPEEQAPSSFKAAAAPKALGNKGSQRVATRAAAAAGASQRNETGSGSSQSQPRRGAPAAHKPSSGGSSKPISADGSQRVQKPTSAKPAAFRKPASTANKPPTATRKEDDASPVPDPDVPKNEPEPEVRAVRALPRRASRSSAVPTIMEDSMEIEGEETRESNTGAEQATPVQTAASTSMSASIWPREPAPNPFAPADDGMRTNKRRAPSAEPEPESTLEAADANDSPNKRVRFNAVLVAGPTPGIGRVLQMPKPSLKKIKKMKLGRKANSTMNASRPKRVLTRDWVVGATPSYAAPLRRDARERDATAVARPAESQTHSRATTSKFNPTVAIPFTFRSELRMRSSQHAEEAPLPVAIPIAAPMPDFATAHAAAEAANLARRQRAQEAFLAAQAQLESCHSYKHMIGGETARRAAERAVFDAAMKVREAETERVHNEQRKLEAEKEAVEIREMRKRMVPKANPVPEFYKYAPRSDTQDLEA